MHAAFQVHRLTETGIEKATKIAEAFDELQQKLAVLCPQGREFALFMTKLEEACFFAKKSMAKDHGEPIS